MSETDSSFPSGPWTGFYTYNLIPGKHRTDLLLEFNNGGITGEGRDKVGSFVIDGNYDIETRECYWLKSYVGRHGVFYRGFRDGKGIWGTWQVEANWRGGFHIWPLADERNNLEADAECGPEPVEAIGTSH